MKKKIIIGAIIFLILAIGVGSYFIFFNKDDDKPVTNNKDEKITVTFDSDGGEKVEDMVVKKGSSFQLPETTKEGYTFAGWYNGSKLYTDDDTASIKKNIVLTAKWEEKEVDPKPVEEEIKLKVIFDSKGGSKLKDMTFKCTNGAATINNLPKSKKDSYEFLSWEDKHGKSILDGASIICEGKEPTLKLYAVWEYDGPVANPEQPTTVTEPVKTEPTCPDGFEKTSDNKCVSKRSPEYYCPDGYKNSTVDNTVCYKYLKAPDNVTCKDGKYHYTQTSSNGSTLHFCATELPSYTGSKTYCEGAGGHLLSNNHCVKDVEQVGNSKLNFTCYSSVFREGSALASGEKDGCYDLKQRTYGCKTVGEGYSMNHTTGKCVKTVNPE